MDIYRDSTWEEVELCLLENDFKRLSHREGRHYAFNDEDMNKPKDYFDLWFNEKTGAIITASSSTGGFKDKEMTDFDPKMKKPCSISIYGVIKLEGETPKELKEKAYKSLLNGNLKPYPNGVIHMELNENAITGGISFSIILKEALKLGEWEKRWAPNVFVYVDPQIYSDVFIKGSQDLSEACKEYGDERLRADWKFFLSSMPKEVQRKLFRSGPEVDKRINRKGGDISHMEREHEGSWGWIEWMRATDMYSDDFPYGVAGKGVMGDLEGLREDGWASWPFLAACATGEVAAFAQEKMSNLSDEELASRLTKVSEKMSIGVRIVRGVLSGSMEARKTFDYCIDRLGKKYQFDFKDSCGVSELITDLLLNDREVEGMDLIVNHLKERIKGMGDEVLSLNDVEKIYSNLVKGWNEGNGVCKDILMSFLNEFEEWPSIESMTKMSQSSTIETMADLIEKENGGAEIKSVLRALGRMRGGWPELGKGVEKVKAWAEQELLLCENLASKQRVRKTI